MISVVGKGRNCPDEVAALARRVGALVAEAGAMTVTGGYAGVMVEAAKGAHASGGTVLAILPSGREVPEDFPGEAIIVRTGLSIPTRNVVVGSCCDAMIALHGSHGALQELAVAIDREVPAAAVGCDTWASLGLPRLEVADVPRWLVDHGLAHG